MAPSSEEHLRRMTEAAGDAEGAGWRGSQAADAGTEQRDDLSPGPGGPSPLGGRDRGGGDGRDAGAGRLWRAALIGLGLGLALAAGAALAWWVLGTVAAVPVGGDAAGDVQSQILTWWLDQRAGELEAPSAAPEAEPVPFEIWEGEALPQVAERLEGEGLIRSADAFRLLARVRGLDTRVQAGHHMLRPNMPAEAVLTELLSAPGEEVVVRIPEGNRVEETATLLANAGLVDRSTFLELVAAGRDPDPARHPAVADRPAGVGLEGYLFPDTYAFDPAGGAEAVLTRILDNFEARVTSELRARAADIGLPLYDVVTLASIVEREAAVAEERGTIARVYLNRLAEAPYILNADPTVQYALGFQPEANTWWKRPLYADDLAVDSAFNTYVHAGLPPGPIASPHLASIEAVLNAPEGPWMYFVADGTTCDGTHRFAETYDEHLRNVEAYQAGSCGP